MLILNVVLNFTTYGTRPRKGSRPSVGSVAIGICNVTNPANINLTGLVSGTRGGRTALSCGVDLTTGGSRVITGVSGGRTSVTTITAGLTSALCDGARNGIIILTMGALNILGIITGGRGIRDVTSLDNGAICLANRNTGPRCVIGSVLARGGIGSMGLRFMTRPTSLISGVITGRGTIIVTPRPITAAVAIGSATTGVILGVGSR